LIFARWIITGSRAQDRLERAIGFSLGSPYKKIDGKTYEVKMVTSVTSGSLAEKAGLQVDDVIVGASIGKAPDLNRRQPNQGSLQMFHKLAKASGKTAFIVLLRADEKGSYNTAFRTMVELKVPDDVTQ
jgi:C-terminal processing protease CtpA/Prc